MLPRFARGKFSPKNQEKYVGTKTPTYRSSWEHSFMRLCDEHPNVYQWASEFIVYQDKQGRKHAEMVEVKPMSQTSMEAAGKSIAKKKQVVVNMAKWEAANAYAKQRRIKFRVVSEEQLFHNGKRK